MRRTDLLKKRINRYLKKEQLLKNQGYTKHEKPFLAKSRKNFTVANLLFRVSEKEDLKSVLTLAYGFEMYDWVIIVSYYAMYTSALAAIAKLGFKSRSHAATIAVLENYYVHENKGLEAKHIHKLTKAYALSEDLITKLIAAKTKRESAQYDATPAISRENANFTLKDADEFITKIEEILA